MIPTIKIGEQSLPLHAAHSAIRTLQEKGETQVMIKLSELKELIDLVYTLAYESKDNPSMDL